MKNTLWWSKTFKRDAWFDLRDLFEDNFLRAGSPPAMVLLFQDLPGSMTEVFYWSAPEQKGLLSNYPGFQTCKATRGGWDFLLVIKTVSPSILRTLGAEAAPSVSDKTFNSAMTCESSLPCGRNQ